MNIIYSDSEAQLAAAKVVADRAKKDALKKFKVVFGDRAEEVFDLMVKSYRSKV